VVTAVHGERNRQARRIDAAGLAAIGAKRRGADIAYFLKGSLSPEIRVISGGQLPEQRGDTSAVDRPMVRVPLSG
jgi:hypothetical protein